VPSGLTAEHGVRIVVDQTGKGARRYVPLRVLEIHGLWHRCTVVVIVAVGRVGPTDIRVTLHVVVRVQAAEEVVDLRRVRAVFRCRENVDLVGDVV
jgi:S-adenosylmethionine synthetase